ncbi:hypothetical protein ACM7VS_29940, partial [Pseudomonas aeruginosa]
PGNGLGGTMGLAIFLLLGVGLFIGLLIGVISAYAGFWHWLFDRLDARQARRLSAKPVRNDGGKHR